MLTTFVNIFSVLGLVISLGLFSSNYEETIPKVLLFITILVSAGGLLCVVAFEDMANGKSKLNGLLIALCCMVAVLIYATGLRYVIWNIPKPFLMASIILLLCGTVVQSLPNAKNELIHNIKFLINEFAYLDLLLVIMPLAALNFMFKRILLGKKSI